MTVKKLINELNNLDPHVQVIISEDEEGNDYRKLTTIDFGRVEVDDFLGECIPEVSGRFVCVLI